MRERARVAPALGVLYLAASLVGEFASSSHELGAAHARCAEHGEITHVAVDPQALGRLPPRADELTHVTGDAAGANSAHEHCLLAAATRRRVLLMLPAGFEAVPFGTPPLVMSPPTLDLPAPGDCLLATAPKTSPPVA
jgi:hypothetical protein